MGDRRVAVAFALFLVSVTMYRPDGGKVHKRAARTSVII